MVGLKEALDRMVKTSIKKMTSDRKTKTIPMTLKMENFLLKYRNTPNSVNGLTPNECIFTFRPRTLLSIINAKEVYEPHNIKKTNEMKTSVWQSTTQKNSFNNNDKILCKAESNTQIKWIKGVVINRESASIYKVKLENGRIRLCHGDQLRKFYDKDKEIIIPIAGTTGNDSMSITEDLSFRTASDGENQSDLESPDISPQVRPENTKTNSNESSEFTTDEGENSSPNINKRLRPELKKNYYETKNRKQKNRRRR